MKRLMIQNYLGRKAFVTSSFIVLQCFFLLTESWKHFLKQKKKKQGPLGYLYFFTFNKIIFKTSWSMKVEDQCSILKNRCCFVYILFASYIFFLKEVILYSITTSFLNTDLQKIITYHWNILFKSLFDDAR